MRHQQWEGWPDAVDNSKLLAQTGIPLEHNLVLRSNIGNDASSTTDIQTQGESSSSTTRRNSNRDGGNDPIEVDSDSSIDEYEDASDFNGDEEIFTTQSQKRVRNLSKFD